MIRSRQKVDFRQLLNAGGLGTVDLSNYKVMKLAELKTAIL